MTELSPAAHQASMNRINNDTHPLSHPDYVAALAHSTAQSLDALRKRVEALEQRPITGTVELAAPTPEAAPVATDDELQRCYAQAVFDAIQRGARNGELSKAALRACYALGRQHGAGTTTQPSLPSPPAPVGRLVERMAMAADCYDHKNARNAIREVAKWLDANGQHGCSLLLREEADR